MTRRRLGRVRRGVTLVELVITVVLIGIVAGVATLAIRLPEPTRRDDPKVILADTLRWALAHAREVTVTLTVDGKRVQATVHPDGSIVADSALHLERFTGASNAAR